VKGDPRVAGSDRPDAALFAEQRLVSCFPTGVWLLRVADAERLNGQLIATIERLRAERPWAPNEAVTDPGYGSHAQSLDDLHLREEFAVFNELALDAARRVLDFLRYRYESFYLTGCWANASRTGEGHRAHVHPNNVLSGVYYAQALEGAGDLVFEDPRPQATVLVPDNREQTPFNSHELRIEARTGLLVMFPSWLSHRVSVSRCEAPRISIAFNVMLRGPVGYEKASATL